MKFRPGSIIILFCLILLYSFFIPGWTREKPIPLKGKTGHRIYDTKRIRTVPPKVDGRLNDACWDEGTWAGDFVQQRPVEGATPSQKTEIKILYDEHNIYVAIRAYDNEPNKIDRQMGRRDMFTGDVVGICFDSYHDFRTGFEFNLTAGGSKVDLLLTNQGVDISWDAVWYGKTAIEDSAWTAEMQIPLSQLRYSSENEQIWGLHAWRWINRNQEECQWNLIPRDSPGPVYDFGELHGIRDIPKSRRIEFLPYSVARLHHAQQTQGDPFADASQKDFSAGLDGKIGVTSDFTMDFTILPDFGQVEADPSVLNLSAYETYFEEKRPFFLEGRNIYQFSTSGQQLVYTRRIGHAPSITPELNEGEYIHSPQYTKILGALKLTGKNSRGLSLGLIESVTSEEYAHISNGITQRKELVEPYTNYFVARVEKDMNNANTVFGGILTAVNRSTESPATAELNREAYSAGMDFRQYLKEKTFYFDIESVISHIRGSKEAIYRAQTSPARYFQRPDAPYVQLDTSRTSLTGTAGSIEFGKGSNGPWRFSESFTWSSPGLELNDMGYLRSTDKIEQSTSLSYIKTEPELIFRSYHLGLGQYNRWDFGGRLQSSSLSLGASAQLSNMWSVNFHVSRYKPSYENDILRGGPSMKEPGGWTGFFSLGTNYARKVSLSFSSSIYSADEVNQQSLYLAPGLNFKLTRALQMSSYFSYSYSTNDMQYITNIPFGGDTRYITASLEQERINMTLRIDYTILPGLTIQYYGSPFIASASYDDYKRITNPVAGSYYDRFSYLARNIPEKPSQQPEINIDEDHDNFVDYVIQRPDFFFRQFRSNLVARWEYKAGSSLYFVWSQGRTGSDNDPTLRFADGFKSLTSDLPNNIFLIKLNYWFSL